MIRMRSGLSNKEEDVLLMAAWKKNVLLCWLNRESFNIEGYDSCPRPSI